MLRETSAILAEINELDRQRRELYRRGEEQGLTAEERERLQQIGQQLSRLWQLRRAELAGRRDPLYPFIEGSWEKAA